MSEESRLVMAVAWSPEFREAPEFLWLQAWVRAQAEKVWDDVDVIDESIPANVDGPLLILCERCLVGWRTLEAMRDAVAGGALAASPRRLAASGLPDLERFRTLRAIESAEEIVLSGGGSDASEPPPHPAVLLSPATASQLGDVAPSSILSGEGLGIEPASIGLCHEFIDYYGEVREDILPFLDPECHDVLEIGCGRGATGAFLQNRLGCRVTGVELNPVVATAAAKCLHRVVVGDILEVDPGGPFDAVVACELFEHLTDGDRFLKRLVSWLRPGGRAVLSVPNVGHHAIVEDLLAGRWDYLPVGLLCSTHYRFFTHRTLEDTLRAAGIEDYEIIPQPTEPPPWLDDLPPELEIDSESLSTQGFYAVIRKA
jgi:SAM-dependent methyltransferase